MRGLNPPSRKEVTKTTVPNLLASPSESAPPLGEPRGKSSIRNRGGGSEIRESGRGGGGWGGCLSKVSILRALEPQGPEKIKLVLQRPLSQTWEPGGLAFRGETGGEGI